MRTGGANAAVITLVRDGDQALIQQGDTQKLVESASSQVGEAALTNGGYLEYLIAAENVEELPPTLQGNETLARYSFAVDGPRFADYMLKLMAAQGQENLPVGLTAQPSPAYQTMTGQGELWVDAAGFPRRQILELEMPEASADYVVRARIVAEFHDFGQVATQSEIVPNGNDAWRIEQQPVPPLTPIGGRLSFSWSSLGMPALALLSLAVCAWLLFWFCATSEIRACMRPLWWECRSFWSSRRCWKRLA